MKNQTTRSTFLMVTGLLATLTVGLRAAAAPGTDATGAGNVTASRTSSLVVTSTTPPTSGNGMPATPAGAAAPGTPAQMNNYGGGGRGGAGAGGFPGQPAVDPADMQALTAAIRAASTDAAVMAAQQKATDALQKWIEAQAAAGEATKAVISKDPKIKALLDKYPTLNLSFLGFGGPGGFGPPAQPGPGGAGAAQPGR